jgi:hypothetical protein
VVFDEGAVGAIGEIRAIRDFNDLGEADSPQRTDQSPRILAQVVRWKRRRDHGHDRRRTGQRSGHFFDAACVGLGVLRTDHRAVAASNASLFDHRGLALDDLDCLGRAFAHARITASTILQNGLNYTHGPGLY